MHRDVDKVQGKVLLSFNRSLDLSMMYQKFFDFQEDYIDGETDF